MKSFAIALALLIGNVFAVEIPMINKAQLKVGNYWVWDIGNDQGLFSREKYTVVAVSADKVTFEMSTAYGAQQEFHLHHQFRVDLADCARAYSMRNIVRRFSVDLTRFENNEWGPTYKMHSRAFEEKFNCNARFYEKHPRFRTEYKTIGAREAFKQRNTADLKDQLNGWYVLEGELSGIMIEKTFNEGTESEFLSVLSEWNLN